MVGPAAGMATCHHLGLRVEDHEERYASYRPDFMIRHLDELADPRRAREPVGAHLRPSSSSSGPTSAARPRCTGTWSSTRPCCRAPRRSRTSSACTHPSTSRAASTTTWRCFRPSTTRSAGLPLARRGGGRRPRPGDASWSIASRPAVRHRRGDREHLPRRGARAAARASAGAEPRRPVRDPVERAFSHHRMSAASSSGGWDPGFELGASRTTSGPSSPRTSAASGPSTWARASTTSCWSLVGGLRGGPAARPRDGTSATRRRPEGHGRPGGYLGLPPTTTATSCPAGSTGAAEPIPPPARAAGRLLPPHNERLQERLGREADSTWSATQDRRLIAPVSMSRT